MSSLASENFRMIISFQWCLFYQSKLLILNDSLLKLFLPRMTTWISNAFNHTQFGDWSLIIVVVVIFNHTHKISYKNKKLHYLCTDYWVLSIKYVDSNFSHLQYTTNFLMYQSNTFAKSPLIYLLFGDLILTWGFFFKRKFPFKFIAINNNNNNNNNNKGRVLNILLYQNKKYLW